MSLLAATPFAERLKARAPSLRQVGFAADLAVAMKPGGLLASPSAFVVMMGAEPYPVADASSLLRQVFVVTFAVLVGVNLAGQRGEAGLKALDQPVDECRAALFGFHHPGADLACRSAGEGVEDFDAATGVLFYRLDFATEATLLETFP